jgi:hypothetical protein
VEHQRRALATPGTADEAVEPSPLLFPADQHCQMLIRAVLGEQHGRAVKPREFPD